MGTQEMIVPGQWVVSVKPYLTPNLVETEHFSTVQEKTADASSFHVEVCEKFNLPEMTGYSAKFDETTKAALESMPHVLSVEQEQFYDHCAVQANAPWGLGRISTRAPIGPSPYSYTYRDEMSGRGTIAYVIDTGINHQHVEFEDRATKGPTFVSDGSSGEDVHGHGTHCAGTIASRAYGVAKKAGVIGVKVFSDRTGYAMTSDIIRGLDWVVKDVATRGIKGRAVVNMSLGGGISTALDAAVASTVRQGIVVCVAAGNASNVLAESQSPGREPLAITVGATNIADELATFSSSGKVVDILAPGVDILSCWVGGRQASNTISGTSMATPHAAGVACCLLSDNAMIPRECGDVMAKILILADKNRIRGANAQPLDGRTVNALLHNSTSFTDV